MVTRIERALLSTAVTILAVGAAAPAFAQQYEGARLLGLAEAQRALTMANDSIYINPAGLALGHMYSLELGYVDDIRGSDRRFNASVVDSQAGPVAGGLAYTWTKRRPEFAPEPDDRLEGHRMEIALATRVAESAAIGLTARYMTFNLHDENGEEIENGGFKIFTVDVGLQWRIFDGLSIGLVGYNLTNSDEPEVPLGWGAGLGYQLGSFSIEGDVRYNAQRGEPRYSGAIGYVLAEMVALRAGVSYDYATEGIAVSGGAGVFLDRFAIDVGYRQLVNADDVGEDSDQRILGIALRALFL
ncbi:MAG: hypothetical protein RIT81_46490 [Deltaproteobacteria bacterium]